MKFQSLFKNWKDQLDCNSGDTIYGTGDAADYLYIVLSGSVELRLHGTPIDTEVTGGVIGELAMLGTCVQTTTAIALTEVKLARIDRKMLKKIIKANNGFSIHVMAALAKRLKAVDQYIIEKLQPQST